MEKINNIANSKEYKKRRKTMIKNTLNYLSDKQRGFSRTQN